MRFFKRGFTDGEKVDALVTVGKVQNRARQWCAILPFWFPLLQGKQDYAYLRGVKYGWWLPMVAVLFDGISRQVVITTFWQYVGDFMGEERFDVYDYNGRHINCPRCDWHRISRRYDEAEGGGYPFAEILQCDRCHHEYRL